MGLTAKDSGGTFEHTPEGTHIARCYRIVDLGEQYSERWSNKAHKAIIMWELPETKMEDGRPFSISGWYTVSLNEKANLRKDLEAWRGKKFSKEEIEGFELPVLLDKTCYINVVHNTEGEKTYANIASIMQLPKGTACPPAVNDQLIFDLDNFSQETFDALPDGIQNIIKKSPEYQLLNQPKPQPENDMSDNDVEHEDWDNDTSTPF